MLSSYGRRHPDDSSFIADANTIAESCTSKGGIVRVSLRCAAPPSSSYLYYDFPKISSYLYYDYYNDHIRVVVAHGEFTSTETGFTPGGEPPLVPVPHPGASIRD
jgi:Na+-transporting NADH:ubiquinone oxidoreductase subunit NqrF